MIGALPGFVIVALGGAIGAALRYSTYILCGKLFGESFPWGTLSVNILGSFAMGAIFYAFDNLGISHHFKFLIMTGLLGAFTTFSTFSLDAWILYTSGRSLEATLYILTSVVCSITALICGILMMKLIMA